MTFHLRVASAPIEHDRAFSRSDAGVGAWTIDRPTPTIQLAIRSPTRSWPIESTGRVVLLVLDGFIRDPVRLDAGVNSQDALPAVRRLLEFIENGETGISGQFVLCVLDTARESVRIFRDRLGGRVAYYRVRGGHLQVSSSACLIAANSRDPDPVYLARHFALTGQETPGRSAFLDVREILPGETLTGGANGIRQSRPPFTFGDRGLRRARQHDVVQFRRHLERTVGSAVGKHENVAVMLSGGLDSASVLAMVSRQARDAGTRITPVSWELPGYPACDESRWIRMAANHYGLEPIVFNADEHLPFATFTREHVGNDSPGYNAFRPLLLECYQRAAEAGCSVVLNGNRGDTLYAPPALALFDAAIRLDLAGLFGELAWILRVKGVGKLHRHPALRYLAARIIRRRRHFPKPPEWLTPGAASMLVAEPRWPPEAGAHAHPDHAAHLLGGRMSFGPAQENEFARRYGIDRRDPYQDEGLVRFMLSVPVSWSIRRGETKRIMRSAMDGILPDALRLKKRTGILTAFMRAGWAKNRNKIKNKLLDHLDDWSPYVDPGHMRKVVDASEPEVRELMLACQGLGLVLWLERLKQDPEWSYNKDLRSTIPDERV